MNNYKVNSIIITVAIAYIIFSLSFGNLSSAHYSKVYGQPSSSSSTVKITKNLNNSYIISSGSSSIGTFDTTYTILGNKDAIKKEQKLVISTVQDDFDKSPIIGYVKISKTSSIQQKQSPTLPNPFADIMTINQKIKTEISSALTSAATTNFAKISIQCDFGMNLPNWKCTSHGILGWLLISALWKFIDWLLQMFEFFLFINNYQYINNLQQLFYSID